jgi:PST family polysaccharide transporter
LSLVGVISEPFAAYFQARERLQLVIAAEATQYLVTGSVAVALVQTGGGLLGVCVAILAGNLAQLALLVVAAQRELQLRMGFDLVLARRLLREAMPLAAMAAFGVVNLRIDVVLLFAMRTEEEVGLYTAAVRIAEIVILASVAFTASVFPRLARLYAADPRAFVRVQTMGAKYLIAAVLPVSVAGAILARDVILFVYGDVYTASAFPFAILIVAELFVFLEIFNTYVLIASGRERFAAAFTIVAGIINVGANLVLITRWGIAGAALASLISYSSYFVLQACFASTRALTLSAVGLSARATLAALVMGLAVASLEPVSPAIALLAAPVVYLLLLLALKGIDLRELRMLFGQRVAEIT